MATATSAIADQLAEVVLCVNYLVEQLEAEEERAELDFFQAERDEIEREFEVRLNELRLTLTKTDLEQANAIRTAAEMQQHAQHQATNIPTKQFQQAQGMTQTVQSQFQQPQMSQPQQPQQQPHQQPLPVVQPTIPPNQQPAPIPVAQFSLPIISNPSTIPQPAVVPAAIVGPSVVSLTAAPLPSLSTPVLLDCGPEHHSVEVWSTHGELIEALAHDGETTRYRLPNVTPHACELLLQCLRARANLMARASINSSNSAAPSVHQFRTNDFVSDIDLSQVLDASNVLRVPWLFILLTTRLFLLNKGDLAFLHSFLSKSFLQHLEPAFMMQLQDRMLHGAYSSISEHEKLQSGGASAASSTHDIVESMKPVWNMFWYQVVSRLFPNYKQHLKSRIQILHHSKAKLQTCAWLEPKDEGQAAEVGKAGAPAPILWVRIYLELSFAKQLLDLTRLSPNSGTQPIKLYEDCMQQWRSMGFLVHYINIDLHPASAGNEAYSPEQKQRIVNFIIPLVKETIHLAALSLNDVQLEPQQFLLLLATAMQLQVLQFKHMEPSMHRSQMQTLQIYQRFPKIQLLLE